MSDSGKIIITKNKDCDNKTYYSAYIYGIDAVIGGGNTRNEAKDELFGNIVFYVNYLIETNQKFKQQLDEKDEQINNLEQMCQICNKEQENELLKQQLAEKDKEIEMLNTIKNNAIECAYLFKIALSVRQKDLAIQELEKVKEKIDCEMAIRECDISEQTADVCVSIADQIDNQIKELKG